MRKRRRSMKMIDLTAVDCKKFSEKCDWSCLVLCTIVDYYTIGNSSKSPLKRFHILHRAVLVKVSTWLCIYSYIYDIFFWLKVSQVPISLDINITNFGGLHGKRELQRKISPRRSEQSSFFQRVDLSVCVRSIVWWRFECDLGIAEFLVLLIILKICLARATQKNEGM